MWGRRKYGKRRMLAEKVRSKNGGGKREDEGRMGTKRNERRETKEKGKGGNEEGRREMEKWGG